LRGKSGGNRMRGIVGSKSQRHGKRAGKGRLYGRVFPFGDICVDQKGRSSTEGSKRSGVWSTRFVEGKQKPIAQVSEFEGETGSQKA